jgi:hypothetical protein
MTDPYQIEPPALISSGGRTRGYMLSHPAETGALPHVPRSALHPSRPALYGKHTPE